jgi:tetratricopeptide (TPR) repeat protein
VEQAIRLSPRDPYISSRYSAIGMVHLLQSRTDEAIVWFEKARKASPAKPFDHLHLAAAYALSGDLDRAVAALAEARRLTGEGSANLTFCGCERPASETFQHSWKWACRSGLAPLLAITC